MRIIVNPASGGGRTGREWPRVSERVRELGLKAPEVFTRAPWHATELAAEAVASGVEMVVAVGGDGTACEVAEGLHRAGGGTLGFLPLGTGNDVARTLGIPVALEDAVETILARHSQEIDLIRVGDHVVLNAIGIGLTGDINRRAARIKVVRGIAVYLVTAVISMFRFCSPRVRVLTPDHDSEGEMTILAVHNGPTTGGGFALTPQARPADGLLDVCLVPGIGPLGRIPRLLAAMKGTLGSKSGTLELRAPWLELHFDAPLPAHLDGNQVELEPPLARFELLPGALRVAVPAPGG